ncbi:hypothetical protein BBBOND_0405260 [Babesia bigemina]|uniref:6-Cys domain-containing protein n=1 Tax=Babesia bigemina TaxID=5866 RepID=A0A061DCW3_BABBI|nr:hypothetical protein BBBOND_0405260 [Babesia bigemina]CDR98042.1 hypothetical protein BBBOND_0405260 [Babesia bigemina]|eukprot:XP_012770228.1 hypothetical protein BBBOND_0405260 [Babesia bigemina]
MAKCRLKSIICAISAICFCRIKPIDALHCDFGDSGDFLSENALFLCRMDITYASLADVICPNRLNGTEYVWHPQPTSYKQAHLKTYLTGNGKFRAVPLSEVILAESKTPLVWFQLRASEVALKVNFMSADTYAITARRAMFICGPRKLVMSDTLQRQLDGMYTALQMQQLPWTPATPLTQELAKIGKPIGVFVLHRGDVHLPLQGCGSRPSPLFAADTEVTVDPNTGVRSCVADPTSRAPIGFVCEGRIEPEECMKSLLDKKGNILNAPTPYSHRNLHNSATWVIAKYFSELALPEFSGECRCIDNKTGEVKATMEIRSKTEYICDIASMIEHKDLQPTSSPWCSVVLHPGSTLTIKLPKEQIYSTSTGIAADDYQDENAAVDVAQDRLTDQSSPPPSVYEYDAEFHPHNLAVVRQLASFYDFNIYDEIMYQDALAGDALELDVSQISQGEVKLKYHLGKPLTLIGGHNSFLYHWTSKSTKYDSQDNIRATVNVSFAFSHEYRIIGCNRKAPRVFDRALSSHYCAKKQMGNGIGDIYECSYNQTTRMLKTGIYCSPDEELLPMNCDSVGYDLSSNQVMPFPEMVRNVTPHSIPGLQVFEIGFDNIPLSHACICVDKRGYETSRFILGSRHKQHYTYLIHRKNKLRKFIPSISPPRNRAELLVDGIGTSKLLTISYEPQRPITLKVGTTLVMSCSLDDKLQHVKYDGKIKAKWLPPELEEFYYTVKYTTNGTRLVRTSYKRSMVTSADGFRVSYEDGGWPTYHQINLESSKSAIVISKDPLYGKFIPMAFVCGKAPTLSDLSIVTDDGNTSDSSTHPIGQTTKWSGIYTWHVVEVAVETTDPYMQGCGVTYESDELFKPETPKLYNSTGERKFGCKIDLHKARQAAFYCPAPYVLDPPGCFNQVLVNGRVKNISDFTTALVASHSNHFVLLYSFSNLSGLGEEVRQTPPLECHCVTTKGVVLSTIQIENYYTYE